MKEIRAGQILDRLRLALHGPHDAFLSEDYLVYTINELEQPMSAEELLRIRGEDIAIMLRGERLPLSEQEKDSVLRHRISYLVDDLVIPTWNATIVPDTPAEV